MSEYVTKEMLEEARKIDLLTYLQNYEPYELVKVSSGTYTTKKHDSIRISNGLWHRFSANIGGKSAIDYLIKVEGYTLPQAVKRVLNKIDISPPRYIKQESKSKEKRIILPKKASTNEQIIDYLMNRGIDESIINYCIINNLIYQEESTNNVVFLGYDDNKNIKYAGLRSTDNERFMKDAKGSSKEFSFRIVNKKINTIHLFESSIDLLSYATLLKEKGYNWKENNMIALSGVYQTQKEISESKIPITIENIKKRILSEQDVRIPFIEEYNKPFKHDFTLSKRKIKVKGFMAIYFHYMYLLRLNNKNPYIKLTPEMKADIAKMDKYSEEAKLLANNKIETSSDLESYYMKKNEELKLALGEREVLWDRRASKKNEDIRQELCNQISEKTEIINRLRKEVLLCEDIKTRIPKMKDNLNELKKEEKAREEEQELKKNKRKEKRL